MRKDEGGEEGGRRGRGRGERKGRGGDGMSDSVAGLMRIGEKRACLMDVPWHTWLTVHSVDSPLLFVTSSLSFFITLLLPMKRTS